MKRLVLIIIPLLLVSLSSERAEKIIRSENHDQPLPSANEVKAIYLTSENILNEKKIKQLEQILTGTSANGIVIDFKDSNIPDLQRLGELAKRFEKQNIYTIARIVTLQDSDFARRHPETAVKTSAGQLWHSGLATWKRYWLDPASPAVLAYTIEVAKRAIDTGFDEIQFDYIRFPSDGNMKDLVYPVFDAQEQNKEKIMEDFFRELNRALTSYRPTIKLGIDIFGEVCLNGKEASIGQNLRQIALYFHVICPMAYPSHYQCGQFDVRDPNTVPYRVYFDTLRRGQKILENQKVIIRPWIQDFSIKNIYDCGPLVPYREKEVAAQIQAGSDLGINGFMLWNAASRFTAEIFK